MSSESSPGNVEQLCRAPLVAIGLLVNESDMPFHSARQRKVGAWLFVVVAVV
jgi:hypothetical protein